MNLPLKGKYINYVQYAKLKANFQDPNINFCKQHVRPYVVKNCVVCPAETDTGSILIFQGFDVEETPSTPTPQSWTE